MQDRSDFETYARGEGFDLARRGDGYENAVTDGAWLQCQAQIQANDARVRYAWGYVLGDGVWRYQREWSPGAQMYPIYELSPKVMKALEREASI